MKRNTNYRLMAANESVERHESESSATLKAIGRTVLIIGLLLLIVFLLAQVVTP